MSQQKLVCLYHKDCIDGTAAAAVIRRKFPDAELIPIGNDYTEDTLRALHPTLSQAEALIIADGTWGIHWLVANFPDLPITIIDHHESAYSTVSKLAASHPKLTYLYDQTHCASVLSWHYLFPTETLPRLLTHVEDGDLWLKRDPATTSHLTTVLFLYRNQPAAVLDFFNSDLAPLIARGQAISTYVDACIEKYVAVPPVKIRFDQHEVLAFNITDLQSACGNYLSLKHDAAVALFTIKGEVVRFSFRSTNVQQPSALDLASTIGGGGHRNSSGGQMSLTDFISRLR